MMEQIKALMAKKVAGIPVMVLVAIFAAVIVYAAIKMKPTEDLPADVTDGTDESLDGDYSTDQPTFAASPALVGSVTGPTVTSEQTTDTNELWGNRARTWLITQGYTVDQVTGMLAAYLNGESLTSVQVQMRDKAVTQFGFPPETLEYAPVIPDPTVPDNDPTPPKNPATGYSGPATRQGVPPTVHTVKGKSDDTSAELSRLYFPNRNVVAGRALIREANGAKNFDIAQKIGTKIRIPKWEDPQYYRASSATRTASQIAAKNSTTAASVRDLNPHVNFPVKVGTRVRVK